MSTALLISTLTPFFDWTPIWLSRESEARAPGYIACERRNVRASDEVTLGCLRTELTRQDLKLNQTYQRVMRHLPPRQRVTLRRLERAWIVQRDRHCFDIGGGKWGGSGGAVNIETCRLDETIKRTIWLERYGRQTGTPA